MSVSLDEFCDHLLQLSLVFKALHQVIERTVAVKILPPDVAKSPDAIQQFRPEVRAVAKLIHSNTVAAYDAAESDGGIHGATWDPQSTNAPSIKNP